MFRIESPKFSLGQIVATPGVLAAVSAEEISKALNRHANGDWGVMPEEDKKANDRALKGGDRIFSAYLSSNNVKFWIITEWDRSATTILFPEDY